EIAQHTKNVVAPRRWRHAMFEYIGSHYAIHLVIPIRLPLRKVPIHHVKQTISPFHVGTIEWFVRLQTRHPWFPSVAIGHRLRQDPLNNGACLVFRFFNTYAALLGHDDALYVVVALPRPTLPRRAGLLLYALAQRHHVAFGVWPAAIFAPRFHQLPSPREHVAA